jgi:hypothetical protein
MACGKPPAARGIALNLLDAPLTWATLKSQFGPDYSRMDNFKRFFRHELKQVRTQYSGARLDLTDQGLILCHSPPPVARKLHVVPGENPALGNLQKSPL